MQKIVFRLTTYIFVRRLVTHIEEGFTQKRGIMSSLLLGEKCIQLLSTLSIFHQDDFVNRMK